MTLRAVREVQCLRSHRTFPAVREVLNRASRTDFRVVHFSVQNDHVHLLVEADDKRALSRGARGLAIRMALAVNRVLGRNGAVWDDRYHARVLKTPLEVRRALVYVVRNAHKHGVNMGLIDPCSSAAGFDGWKKPLAIVPQLSPVVAPAQTWLLSIGWQRHGLIDPHETPAGPSG